MSNWLKRRLGLKQKDKKADDSKTKTVGAGHGADAPQAAEPGNIPVPPSEDVGPLVLFDNIGTGSTGTDIVFVHGLRGARVGTWSKDSVCWPDKLLREDVKDVRVITWGYDASIVNAFQPASQDSLWGHSSTLLEDLARLRAGTVRKVLSWRSQHTDAIIKQIAQTRPILFVCHSLGGLVVKEALITSKSYVERHPTLAAIARNTTGIIFMGTPHRGSKQEEYGDILAKAASLFRRPNEQLLQTLRPDSNILEKQRDDFTTVSKDLVIFCVREELSTAIGLVSALSPPSPWRLLYLTYYLHIRLSPRSLPYTTGITSA
jgi:protein SERAC1